MSGAVSVRTLASNWKTEEKTVGVSSAQVTRPASMVEVRTVMIQADKSNSGCIVFGDATTVTITTGLGGQLQAGQTAVLPLDLVTTTQQLFVIADTASQKYYVSYFDGGQIC